VEDHVDASAGLRLGRIAGIEVHADWSLLIIFLLITFSLGAGVFPAWHPNWSPALSWVTALAAAALFFASVLLHELSHALVGRRYGIEVNRITLFMFGGMAHMENEPPTWRAELAMAIAGPMTSLALGIGFWILVGLTAGPVEIDPESPASGLAALDPASTLLFWLAPVNVILGVFNLVPGFPLDGGRVLRAIIWGTTGDLANATRLASRMGQVVAWALMAIGLLMMLGVRVPFFGTGPVSGLWLAFIGWFLNNAALASYRQLLLRESLENVPVARLMQRSFERVDPDMPVSALVNEHLMASGQHAFPVERDGRFLGMVCVRDLQKALGGAAEHSRAGDIMTPAERLVTVTPATDAMEALALLGRQGVNQLPVVENGRLVGLLRREDLVKWLTLHSQQPAAGGLQAHHRGRTQLS
jgi:Zn-dependent protease/predicted transcriptional regulator